MFILSPAATKAVDVIKQLDYILGKGLPLRDPKVYMKFTEFCWTFRGVLSEKQWMDYIESEKNYIITVQLKCSTKLIQNSLLVFYIF